MKERIRCAAHAARKNHAPGEIRRKSAAIRARLFRLPDYRKAKTVMFYAAKDLEVQTLDAIRLALKGNSKGKGKRVAVPLVKGDKMDAIEIRSAKDLAPGAFGVPEPRRGKKIGPKEIDLVVVPGVAFDTNGNRVGYGKGFYDKYLKKSVGARTVGLAYEFQIAPRVPAECHDVRVNFVITEKRTIKCAE